MSEDKFWIPMFILSKFKDTIRVDAQDSGSDTANVIKQVINRKYSNRVVPNVGLCIATFDILNASEGMVFYGDGCLYYKVIFRLVVFHPLIDEAFEAKVASCTEHGLRMTTRFFDDIHIPKQFFPEGAAYDPRQARWFWYPSYEELLEQIQPAADIPDDDRLASDDEASTVKAPNGLNPNPAKPIDLAWKLHQKLINTDPNDRFYIEIGETVRLRVVDVIFNDSGPTEPPKPILPGATEPLHDQCSIQEPGLGVVGWWRPSEDADVEDGGDEAMEG